MTGQVRSSSQASPPSIARIIADELGVQERQVQAVIELLEEGATVPFIARYRKERTGGLDDTQLRTLSERLDYLTDLAKRRETVLSAIREQGKLTPVLEREINWAITKVALEDLYAPYKQKRRTKATIAKEAGLEPLAERLLANPSLSPFDEARAFIASGKGVKDLDAALEGARDILVERIAETPRLVGKVRETVWKEGKLGSSLVKGKEQEGAKFADYFDFDEPVTAMPSHRALAVLRGQKEGVLKVKLAVPVEPSREHPALREIRNEFGIAKKGRPGDDWLMETAEAAWKSKLEPSSSRDVISRVKEGADREAIKVFSRNMHDLLMAAPAGPKVVMGIDPGIRTGCKVAVVDATGKLLETATIYPHEPKKDWAGSLMTLATLCKRHKVELVSVGNGTAGRETEKLVGELNTKLPDLKLTKIMVSEAGASVYSASELAAKEFPQLDVSLRGAVSIARRLQDPLAELVKIEPKAIGVGQYQHDVDQTGLARSLDGVVEDCVNAVGVDVNTASVALLSRVAGLNATIAANIVAYREQNGPFKARTELKKVPRFGPKAFEQAAGFLRIMNGKNPLDASAVHPEAYPVVERIAKAAGRKVETIIGDKGFVARLKPEDYADETFGVPTVKDILKELEKPGRDPRPEFKTATFQEGIEKVTDLKPGMRLEGVVTNVTAFGAFVDVGVKQDGLVHISEMSDTFIKDPHEVVKTGQVVSVVVMDVDVARNRIGLSMKQGGKRPSGPPPKGGAAPSGKSAPAKEQSKASDSPFSVLSRLK
ncbi:S1 RNA-binding domain-containing protein [Hyphomonas polymorpha PS728]|uniref:Small ribosomal subunit protein bS1 n=1 Tax=Hyphomonas polymorpha PS728 TaxID=1280954 RepID=A0A062VA01_9PROT|nr:Tex family protein [Hyphomonas polymorpha]KCZ96979.1 S1 RNA-binding domain-containing protein [Hyphomonas polymorpha PS728]